MDEFDRLALIELARALVADARASADAGAVLEKAAERDAAFKTFGRATAFAEAADKVRRFALAHREVAAAPDPARPPVAPGDP